MCAHTVSSDVLMDHALVRVSYAMAILTARIAQMRKGVVSITQASNNVFCILFVYL